MSAPRPEISGRQRKYLRGKAHSLQPLVRVGRAGLSDAVIEQVDAELARHELIKVRLDAEREERSELAERIASATGAAIAGEIGRIAILYRPHPDPEKRRFTLPE
jgi:RNA-binding protein